MRQPRCCEEAAGQGWRVVQQPRPLALARAVRLREVSQQLELRWWAALPQQEQHQLLLCLQLHLQVYCCWPGQAPAPVQPPLAAVHHQLSQQ